MATNDKTDSSGSEGSDSEVYDQDIHIISDDSDNPDDPSRKEILSSWDLQIVDNAKDHNTDKYYVVQRAKPTLVVRRGQVFKFKVTFKEKFTAEVRANVLFQIAKTGLKDTVNRTGTTFQFPMKSVPPSTTNAWGGFMIGEDLNTVTMGIISPANCIIGKWRLFVGIKHSDDTVVYNDKTIVMYILFNPWCADDQVYLEDSALRNECILENMGAFYYGYCNTLNKRMWGFGQFEKNILRCSFYIIEKLKKMDVTKQGNAIEVCRILSTMGSYFQTQRVLVGRWDGKYIDGTRPDSWQNSKQILDAFWNTKNAVKFGQCWAFAGILVTVARAIGIPSRLVSGTSIGRDTNANMTIDIIIDEMNSLMYDKSEDFTWNLHVWSECWMKRPDLKHPLYDGWQVVDSTPLIISANGEYAMGPASVAAIKEGDVLKPYDTGYVFTELNADKVVWRFTAEHQPLKLVKAERSAVGLCVNTKEVGTFESKTITSTYKYPEGSPEERESVRRAMTQSKVKNTDYLDYLNKSKKRMTIEIKADPEKVTFGQSFRVIANLNVVDTKYNGRKAKLYFSIQFVVGGHSFPIYKFPTTKEITLESGEILNEQIPYDSYKSKFANFGTFNASVIINSIDGTELEAYESKEILLSPPKMLMEKLNIFELFFLNSLPHAVTGYFEISGPGSNIQTNRMTAEPSKSLSFVFVAKKPDEGKKMYTAYFKSGDMLDLEAAVEWDGNKWEQVAD